MRRTLLQRPIQGERVEKQHMDFKGRRVTVMGLGSFGGGIGVTRYLAKQGARVTVTDLKTAEQLADSVAQLADVSGVTFHLGQHVITDFTQTEVLIVNPAVLPSSPYLKLAADNGATLDTEMNIFFRQCPAPIAGVTGSDGKSTTTSLLAAMLENTGRRVWLGGNLGISLLDKMHEVAPSDIVVLEMSSFQLERMAWLNRSPHLSLVTNISPNHFDWHGDMNAYSSAKQNILRYQSASDLAVLNADDSDVCTWGGKSSGKAYLFSAKAELPEGSFATKTEVVLRLGGREDRISLRDFKLVGPHNRANAAAAALGAALLGADATEMLDAINNFKALIHRLEPVGEVNGVRYYNDSKATTPVSSLAALRSFEEPIILIAGGYDKHVPFDILGREAATRAKAVILIGETAEKIGKAIPIEGRRAQVIRASDLSDAVKRASALATPGDVVLLSPACASYGMFRNYEERGDVFRTLVQALCRDTRPK
jgi:UDP-N-acetylmuramoylalanine--D-glutamate ligase